MKRVDPIANEFRPISQTWEKGELHGYTSGQEKNSTRTIIFVHGSPGHGLTWGRYLADPELKENATLLTYDRPGFGRTAGPPYLLPDQTSALLSLIDSCEGPVTLAGHSLGGPLVINAMLERPQKVEHSIVISGSIAPKHSNIRPMNILLEKSFLGRLLPKDLKTANTEVYALKPELELLKNRIQNIKGKVTIVQGGLDVLVPRRNSYYLKEQLTQAEVKFIFLPLAGHFIPWTQYDLIKSELLLHE